MAEEKRIATRVSYGEELVALGAERDDFVVLDADLAAATQTSRFKAAYPDRFFDCGIAEGNMVGVAAGIAAAGKKVFCSTFAMFAAGRAFEQVRNSIGYPHLNVNICATHAGISVGEDGATHQCCEDIALMRSIPGMTVIVPSDDTEARAAVRAALDCAGPVYIRLGRLAAPVINDPVAYDFKMGRGVTLREGGRRDHRRNGTHGRGSHRGRRSAFCKGRGRRGNQYPHREASRRRACARLGQEDGPSCDMRGALNHWWPRGCRFGCSGL